MHDRLRALLREPLVHFLLGGLAIFLFFGWRGADVDPASRTIVIDRAQVERLAGQFVQTYRRPPTSEEIDGLIRDHVKEEVYNREARRLGLDIDDTVIRQRLRQKMEYLARSSAESAQPNDAALQKLIDANPARYAGDVRYSFDQIYLGERDAGTAAQVRARLARGADWEEVGTPLSVPASMEEAARADVERQFGDAFADALALLSEKAGDKWLGPVASGYGLHLVRLRAVITARKPKLAQVRQQVENDWRAQTVDAREAAAYRVLLGGYTIRIDKP